MSVSGARLRQIESIYHAARARPSEEREAFLTGACAGDPALREEVDRLRLAVRLVAVGCLQQVFG